MGDEATLVSITTNAASSTMAATMGTHVSGDAQPCVSVCTIP